VIHWIAEINMERTNVTLSLPVDTVRRMRHLAVDHNISLSALVTVFFEERIAAPSESYSEVAKRAIARLERGYHLGPMQPFNRDETHER
jgi:hypothetical protein